MSDLPGFGSPTSPPSYASPILTNRATAVLAEALQTSRRLNRDEVGTEHLLLALLSEGVVVSTLQALAVDTEQLAARVRALAPAAESRSQTPVPSLAQVRKALDLAEGEARQMKRPLGPEHLLLGLLAEEEGLGPQLLRQAGASLEAARQQVQQAKT